MGKLSFLDDEQRDWIDWRWGWLRTHIGAERMRAAKVPTTTAEFLPHNGPLTETEAQDVATRIGASMGLADRPIHVVFSYEEHVDEDQEYKSEYEAAWAGDTSLVIGLSVNYLADPHHLAIDMMSEIGRAYIYRTVDRKLQTPDLKTLGELAAIQFGCGVILANNELLTEQSTLLDMYHERSIRMTALSTQELGYALARFAYDRQEQSPKWGKQLRADPKGFYKRSLAAFKTEPPKTRSQPPQWYTDVEHEVDPDDGNDEGWSPEELELANPIDSKPPERLIYCRNCAYPVNHLPAGDCPECGQPFDPEDMASITLYKPEFTGPLAKKVINFSRRFLLACLVVFCVFMMCFVVIFLFSTFI